MTFRFGISICSILIFLSAASTFGYAQQDEPAEFVQEQDFNDLLMLLDAFGELEPTTRFPAAPASVTNASPLDGGREAWLLTFLELWDEQSQLQKSQSESELRSALMSLRRAESVSEGEVKSTLTAAAENIGLLMFVAEQQAATTDTNVRFVIAEAQRAMGLYHCSEANKEASGSLADSLAMISKRLDHLSIGARLMMSAAQTANYRIPEETKRTIASSVAMSKLFEPNEVSLSQIRRRARDITAALGELGLAIKRMR